MRRISLSTKYLTLDKIPTIFDSFKQSWLIWLFSFQSWNQMLCLVLSRVNLFDLVVLKVDDVMFVFCSPGLYSLVVTNERLKLELIFTLKCRSDRAVVSTLKISNLFLDRLGKPYMISARNFLFLMPYLTGKSFNLMFLNILELKNTLINKMTVFL